MRGLAALSVTWFHLTNSYPHDLVGLSGAYGWLGVDAFFVISGFVIPYSLSVSGYRMNDFARFMARRMVRLEPPYIASVLLVVALNSVSSVLPHFAGAPQKYTLLQLLSHALYIVPLTSFQWIQPVYWSLAYEFVFYISVGLAFWALWPRNIMFTLAFAAVAVGLKFAISGMWDARIVLFALGAGAARHYIGRDGLTLFLAGLLACVLAMVAMGSPASATVGVVAALVIALIRAPAWAPLTFLGSISYSLYLIHVPIGGRIVNFGRRFGEGPAYELLLSLSALMVSLIVAWIFYRLIETTATRWSRQVALHPDEAR
jgi:peptidoglycan/LPS O-acetylase OafA/YrhL